MGQKFAVVSYLLIAVNIIVFVQTLAPTEYFSEYVNNYGLVPTQIMHAENLYTLLTYMFLHADIWHLAMNMLFLLLSGDAIERELGSSRFLALYLACGIISGLFHSYMNNTSTIPTIGASGAIFGLLAAFAILFPFRWVFKLFGFIPVPLPALLFVFITVLTETAYVYYGTVEN
ncbi:MAG: rhomboid family intramembrane serine protease, partial [Candidatus Bathyarchaeota archaeon]|nr:rhomboid family intramembrane serine protease [Candidatus Bathyarchaeota archaeon]